MISFVNRISKTKMSPTGEESSNGQRETIKTVELVNVKQPNGSSDANNLRLHRGASIDVPQEGYGKVARSGVCHRASPNPKIKSHTQTLANQLNSSIQYFEGPVNLEGTVNAISLPAVTTEEEQSLKKFEFEQCARRNLFSRK